MSSLDFEMFLDACMRLKDSQQSFVTITLVKCVGSAPQNLGARAIVNPDGLFWGTIGGGKLELRAIQMSLELLRGSQKKIAVDWNLQTDLGMTCGGVVTLFFEVFQIQGQFSICIFGAGHVSQALSRLLLHLDCLVTVVDSRQEWLDKLPLSDRLKKVHTADPSSFVEKIANGSYVVIMTMGHSTDLPILIQAMRQQSRFSYVGNMGSGVKAKKLRVDLLSAGLTQLEIQNLHCPIGEPIGGNSPSEIGFSIVAQLLKIQNGRSH